MNPPSDLLKRKTSAFILWRLGSATTPPLLIIGQLQAGSPVSLINERQIAMTRVPGIADLWEAAAINCNLKGGQIYYYWFEVTASNPDRPNNVRIRITDPTAYMVDWRIRGPVLPAPFTDDDRFPASVALFKSGKLMPPDLDGNLGNFSGEPRPDSLPPNNRLVIYELPTAWTRSAQVGSRDVGVGSFTDILALIDANAEGENFDELDVTKLGRSYLTELGVNALELLPIADSIYDRQWGYGTTNYFAPDFELGFPSTYTSPAPNRDLGELVRACHINRIRFFVDVVMAFAKCNPYLEGDCDEFFLLDPGHHKSDPDAHNSRGQDDSNLRNGFGASLFRYAQMVNSYDPISGQTSLLSPARQLMKASLVRWMLDFHIDGIRMDSVENVQNWDFIQEYNQLGRSLYQQRFLAAGANGADERFLVVGEELNEPLELLNQKRLDGLWHQSFKDYIRMALLGRNHEREQTFEATVRKAIDCRAFGFSDMSQAIIYLTSHDVEGFRNERLYNFFKYNGIFETEQRIKLGFACLLTAVGIPMILSGDEFADEHDLFDVNGNVTQDSGKQVDPVNFNRLGDDWRKRIKEYVSSLVKLRTTHDALAVNDTEFIHVDFEEGKRVLVWRRGVANSASQVVVLANFSDYATPDALNPQNPNAQYVVPNWPQTPNGKQWKEVTQNRAVPAAQIGREPIFPWEAKVYALF
ncbi:MAG TPA: alpha-amylase family glycosyl hydrolase [Verrucomicrobiae bacterium]